MTNPLTAEERQKLQALCDNGSPLPWGLDGCDGQAGTDSECEFHCDGIHSDSIQVATSQDMRTPLVFYDSNDATLLWRGISALPRALFTISQLEERVKKLEGALTPSTETKAAYTGEFSVKFMDVDHIDGNEVARTINVPWTTIKQIMAAIRSHALKDTQEEENTNYEGL